MKNFSPISKKMDKFDFSIPAAHAYGLVNEDMIVDLPQEIFKDVEAEEMVVGHVLPMMDSVGRRLQGKILSDKAIPAGQPSITPPTALPGDSRNDISRKNFPIELPDIKSRKYSLYI